MKHSCKCLKVEITAIFVSKLDCQVFDSLGGGLEDLFDAAHLMRLKESINVKIVNFSDQLLNQVRVKFHTLFRNLLVTERVRLNPNLSICNITKPVLF